MVQLAVNFHAQNFSHDCWYAALRMLFKHHFGPNAEPPGFHNAELRGAVRESEREQAIAQNAGNDIATYHALRVLPPQGLNLNEFDNMANANGLVDVAIPAHGFTAAQLDTLLTQRGPLWCARGYGHIAVLTGVDPATGVTTSHDPQAAAGANTNGNIQGFNFGLVAVKYLDPTAIY